MTKSFVAMAIEAGRELTAVDISALENLLSVQPGDICPTFGLKRISGPGAGRPGSPPIPKPAKRTYYYAFRLNVDVVPPATPVSLADGSVVKGPFGAPVVG